MVADGKSDGPTKGKVEHLGNGTSWKWQCLSSPGQFFIRTGPSSMSTKKDKQSAVGCPGFTKKITEIWSKIYVII